MTTQLDLLEDRQAETGHKIMFIAPFIAQMGDPREWEHRGEVIESNEQNMSCVCGHAIMTAYIVNHKTDPKRPPAALGCECINHFKAYNPDMFQALVASATARDERIKVAKATAKAAADSEKVTVARARHATIYNRLCAVHESYRSRGAKSPYELWEALASRWRSWVKHPESIPNYKRACDMIRWHIQQAELQEALAERLHI